MPRNVEENVYITIAFARSSSTWKRLQSEATALDISVASLIKVLLADRTAVLEGHGKHLWFPREISEARTRPTQPSPEASLSHPVGDATSRRAAAAAAAASYWDD
jgi:hypothetical protein